MRIAMASDHAGFDYKERLKLVLIESGHEVEDFGTDSEQPVDYPLFIRPAAEAVAAGHFDRGIIFGGSGNGEAIVANRVRGIRCTLCWSVESARLARQHNDANMLSMGQRLLDFDEVLAIVEVWLETPFEGGRHLRRIRMIDRPVRPPSKPDSHRRFPQRTELIDAATFVCDCCRQEFLVPIDISAGASQQLVEECPVCSHENTIFLTLDESGTLIVHGDQHITG